MQQIREKYNETQVPNIRSIFCISCEEYYLIDDNCTASSPIQVELEDRIIENDNKNNSCVYPLSKTISHLTPPHITRSITPSIFSLPQTKCASQCSRPRSHTI